MVWVYFTGDQLSSLIVCNEKAMGTNKYKDIIYNNLIWLVEDLLEPLEKPEMIWITDETTFLFM